jgi:hypothetical protein
MTETVYWLAGLLSFLVAVGWIGWLVWIITAWNTEHKPKLSLFISFTCAYVAVPITWGLYQIVAWMFAL